MPLNQPFENQTRSRELGHEKSSNSNLFSEAYEGAKTFAFENKEGAMLAAVAAGVAAAYLSRGRALPGMAMTEGSAAVAASRSIKPSMAHSALESNGRIATPTADIVATGGKSASTHASDELATAEVKRNLKQEPERRFLDEQKLQEVKSILLGLRQGLKEPLHGKVAVNPSVMKTSEESRAATIEGASDYLRAKAQQTLPKGLSNPELDIWYERQAKSLTPELVSTTRALNLEGHKDALADPKMVRTIAEMVGPKAETHEYAFVYNALKHGKELVAQISARQKLPH